MNKQTHFFSPCLVTVMRSLVASHFKHLFYFWLCASVYVCMNECHMHVCAFRGRKIKEIKSPKISVVDTCEQPDVGARSWIQICRRESSVLNCWTVFPAFPPQLLFIHTECGHYCLPSDLIISQKLLSPWITHFGLWCSQGWKVICWQPESPEGASSFRALNLLIYLLVLLFLPCWHKLHGTC